MQTAEGKLYLYVAIDRTSKIAFVQIVRKTGRTPASAFLAVLIAVVPYRIPAVLTDNGIQLTFPPRHADGPTARYMTHMFDMPRRENGIEHRLTKIKHPGTERQSARRHRYGGAADPLLHNRGPGQRLHCRGSPAAQAPDKPPGALDIGPTFADFVLGYAGRAEARLQPGGHLRRKGLVAQKELALPEGMNGVAQDRI